MLTHSPTCQTVGPFYLSSLDGPEELSELVKVSAEEQVHVMATASVYSRVCLRGSSLCGPYQRSLSYMEAFTNGGSGGSWIVL